MGLEDKSGVPLPATNCCNRRTAVSVSIASQVVTDWVIFDAATGKLTFKARDGTV